jgi:hypothetical protein
LHKNNILLFLEIPLTPLPHHPPPPRVSCHTVAKLNYVILIYLLFLAITLVKLFLISIYLSILIRIATSDKVTGDTVMKVCFLQGAVQICLAPIVTLFTLFPVKKGL